MNGSTSIDYKRELETLVTAATKYATAWACHHKEWNAAMQHAKNVLKRSTMTAEEDDYTKLQCMIGGALDYPLLSP
jgi:hypothetical protein